MSTTTIEQIARELLLRKISFTYEDGYLKASHPYIGSFTASYHNVTKKLVIMDGDFLEISITDILQQID